MSSTEAGGRQGLHLDVPIHFSLSALRRVSRATSEKLLGGREGKAIWRIDAHCPRRRVHAPTFSKG